MGFFLIPNHKVEEIKEKKYIIIRESVEEFYVNYLFGFIKRLQYSLTCAFHSISSFNSKVDKV
jgi:hypothetical protein